MKSKNIILKTAQKYVGKARKLVNKHSPTILIIAGATGVVAGVVLAAKAGSVSGEKTKKAKEELDYVHQMKDRAGDEPIKEEYENGEIIEHVYTKMDYAKDLTHAYANLIFAYAKVYGPAALTTLFSLLLIFQSHRMMKNRYAAVSAGFVTMSKAYDQYRKNVIESEGEEADERYRFGIKAIDEEKPLFDKDGNPKLDKDGNQKKVKVTRHEAANVDFDFRSILWAKETAPTAYDDSTCLSEAEEEAKLRHNIDTLTICQNAMNNKMKARAMNPFGDGIGWITWEEAAEILGYVRLPKKVRKTAKRIIWLYDPRLDPEADEYDPNFKKPVGWGDNKVDLGLKNPKAPGYYDRQKFMAGIEDAVLLYMNYDGTTDELW